MPSTPGALALSGATPGGKGGLPGATPMRIRDQLGLNEGMTPAAAGYGGAGSLRQQKAAAAALRWALGLSRWALLMPADSSIAHSSRPWSNVAFTRSHWCRAASPLHW